MFLQYAGQSLGNKILKFQMTTNRVKNRNQFRNETGIANFKLIQTQNCKFKMRSSSYLTIFYHYFALIYIRFLRS